MSQFFASGGQSIGFSFSISSSNDYSGLISFRIDWLDLLDIFRTFYPNEEEYTFFSSTHGTFSRIDHILGHKSNLSKFKKMKNTIKHLL